MTIPNIRVGRLVRQSVLRVRVSGMRRSRARMWLGIQLLKLARLVAGFGHMDVEIVKPERFAE